MLNDQPYSYPFDIWSLGCIAYELCTLKHPFLSANGRVTTIANILFKEFTPIKPKGDNDPLTGFFTHFSYRFCFPSLSPLVSLCAVSLTIHSSLPYHPLHAQQGSLCETHNQRYSLQQHCPQTRSQHWHPPFLVWATYLVCDTGYLLVLLKRSDIECNS